MKGNRLERRKSPRADVRGDAVVVVPDGKAGCVVQNLSATGARLRVPNFTKLPAEFDVLLLKTKSTRRVALRWRRGDVVGVEFT